MHNEKERLPASYPSALLISSPVLRGNWEVAISYNHVYVLLIILIRIMIAKLISITNGSPEKKNELVIK